MTAQIRPGALERLFARPLEEAVVLLFSGLVLVVVVPFACIRLLQGAWWHALLDAVVIAFAAAIGLSVWRHGYTDRAGAGLTSLFLGALLAVVHLFGTKMLFWSYPVTTATYFLLVPQWAIAANGAALAAVFPRVLELGGWPDVLNFLGPLIANNILAFVFAAGMRRSRTSLRRKAEADPLTGAGNRRALEPALEDALRKRASQGIPASLIVLDIDHFKAVNDRHGHEVGDRVLVEIVGQVGEAIRAGDGLFRYGGEELVVIADGASRQSAGWLAEKVRERISGAPVAGVGHVAVSAGVAEARADDTPKSWFQRADEMLYLAKADGRDRVRVESVPGTVFGSPAASADP